MAIDKKVVEEEEKNPHGNTGLPFGLCIKYGIQLPNTATPRDAWEALKGKGIYPPWTDKGKDQYTTDKKDTKKEHLSKDYAKTIEDIKGKMAKMPSEYREKVSQSFENLDDDEINMIATAMPYLSSVEKGSGRGNSSGIMVPTGSPTAADKANGYDFRAATFFHELGHFLDANNGDGQRSNGLFGRASNWYSTTREANIAYDDDIAALMSKISAEMGVKPINLDRVSRDQYVAINNWVAKYTGSAEIGEYPSMGDYVKTAPYKPLMSPVYEGQDKENQIARLINWGYSRSDAEAKINSNNVVAMEWNNKRTEEYNTELAKYNEYVNSGKRAEDEARLKADRAAYNKRVSDLAPRKQRAGYISDFIGGYTGGKINPYKDGEWGHPTKYHKDKKDIGMFGIETFAEYNSARMAKDKELVTMMKEVLPKTVAYYEKLYNKYK